MIALCVVAAVWLAVVSVPCACSSEAMTFDVPLVRSARPLALVLAHRAALVGLSSALCAAEGR